MKIDKVIVRLEANLNLRPYESLKPSVQFEAALEEGDDDLLVTSELARYAREHIAADLMDMAEVELQGMDLHNIHPNDRVEHAAGRSVTFRWVNMLDPELGETLVQAAVEKAEKPSGWTGDDEDHADGGAEGGVNAPGEVQSDIPF